jgi:hypothetical protein
MENVFHVKMAFMLMNSVDVLHAPSTAKPALPPLIINVNHVTAVILWKRENALNVKPVQLKQNVNYAQSVINVPDVPLPIS